VYLCEADFEYTALQEGLLLFHGHVVDSWSINQDLTASSARLSLVADRDPIVEDAGLEFLHLARPAYHHLLSQHKTSTPIPLLSFRFVCTCSVCQCRRTC